MQTRRQYPVALPTTMIKDNTRKIPAITVYGASSRNIDSLYFEAARAVGAAAARAGAAIVDGGGATGLMGAVNDGCLEVGGTAIGVIPRFMNDRGWAHPGLSQLNVTDDMHSRKAMMASLATGIIALPGGVGTMEELLEIITWRKLNLFFGNIVILNTAGYWDNMLAMLNHAVGCGFMKSGSDERLWTVTDDPEEAVRIALTPVIPDVIQRSL